MFFAFAIASEFCKPCLGVVFLFGIDREMLMNFLVRALVLFTAMPVHECAHGLVADRLGDDTPRSQGRLTLNPFAHLEWSGTILLFFTGFGWAKPVEVNMRKFKHPRRDMALVSVAGPLSNLLLALLGIVIVKLLLRFLPTMRNLDVAGYLVEIIFLMLIINVRLAVFNILPVPPLDGSKIIGAVLPEKIYWFMLRYQREISTVLILLLIFNLLDGPLIFLSDHVLYFLDNITSPLGKLLG